MLMFILTVCFLIWIISLSSKVSNLESSLTILQHKFEKLEKNSKKYIDIAKPVQIEQEEEIKQEEYQEYISNDIKPKQQDEALNQIFTSEKQTQNIYNFTQQSKADSSSFENVFLGNIFNIIGAIAIIIGCGIFIKLISPFIIFTPLLKTLIGLIIGSAMVIGGCIMKKDTLKVYSEILTGTGFAVLFITIYCTTVLFQTFSYGVCSFLGILILLTAYYIADKQKTSSMLAISLIGGYLNIFLINSANSGNNVFTYLLFLNLLSVIFVFRNPEKYKVNIINLITTLVFSACLNINTPMNIIYPIALWSMYLIVDFIIKNRNLSVNNSLLNWTNLACLICMGFIIYIDKTVNLGVLLLGSAIIYGIILAYFVAKNSEKAVLYLDSMLISTLISVYFICSDSILRIAIWSIIAIFLSIVTAIYKNDFLHKRVIMFLSCSVVNLFFIPEIYACENTMNYIPVLNTRLLAFISPILGFYISYLLINKIELKDIKNISVSFRFSAITLIYLFLILELNNYINVRMEANEISYSYIKPILYSIIGFIYAIQMRYYEKIYSNGFFYVASIIAYGLAAFILLVSGLSYLPLDNFIPLINIRFIAFIMAIFTSILFGKWTKYDIYKYIAVILGFILISVEAIDYINKYDIETNYFISILWILYVGIITTIGIFKNNKVLKNSGIWLSFITLGRIFIFDLANIESIYKLIIFITLGTIFMITSYLYNKNKK